MSVGLYRVRLPDGSIRSASGSPTSGPTELLDAGLSVDAMLGDSAASFREAMRSARAVGPVPEGCEVLAPVGSQEVWAAGVTYLGSKQAREQESAEDSDVYARVYRAARPELFFKSAGWRVRGSGQAIAIRADSSWNVPEPELAIVLSADLQIAGFTIGNDVSSRSIEGENPLYLPQAKTYDGSCALGPSIVVEPDTDDGFSIDLEVSRHGSVAFAGKTSTGQMHRTFDQLIGYLGRALHFPVGAVLMTGTGVIPEPSFTLQPGDLVRITIDGLGVLENPVVLAR